MELSVDSKKQLWRGEKRDIIKEFYSVEVHFDDKTLISQYVIYDMSSSGLCLLIKEDSELLENIKVGGIYKMKYYPLNLLEAVQYLETEIRHITKSESKKYDGHYLVGLSLQSDSKWD